MKFSPSCALRYPDEMSFCFVSGESLQSGGDPWVGVTIDGLYLVDEKLHTHGGVTTYRAQSRLFKRSCAIDLIHERLDPERVERLQSAVKLARRCLYPSVVGVVDGKQTGEGAAYLVRDLPVGTPLDEHLRAGPLPLERALGVAAQVLRTLARVHDFGVVHGDLNTMNVLVDDTGVARLDRVAVGRTLFDDPWRNEAALLPEQNCLAPERELGIPATPASDMYAVGALVVRMLSGGTLTEADDVEELKQILAESERVDDAVLGSAPEWLKPWLRELLEPDVERRLDHAQAALTELLKSASDAGCSIGLPELGASVVDSEPVLATDFALWAFYRSVFEEMVKLAFPGGAPSKESESLLTIIGRVTELEEVATKATYHRKVLHDIESRGMQARDDIAAQMEEINERTSALRVELRPLRAAVAQHADEGAGFPDEMRKLHQEVVVWEGRSGFAEPHEQLVKSYRAIADLVEKWHGVRAEELRCIEEASKHEDELSEVSVQLTELRERLRVSESNLEAERLSCTDALAELGQRVEHLNLELIELASRFSAPLRSKPELGACFRKLQDGP